MLTTLLLMTILLPWTGAVAIWLVGKVGEQQRERLQHSLAVGFSLLAAACGLVCLGMLLSQPSYEAVTNAAAIFTLGGAGDPGRAWGTLIFVPDGLGVFLAFVATFVGSLAVIFSVDYMRGDKQLGRYYALILLFIGAMCGIVLTNSLLYLFFFWEITALTSYALISFYNDDPKAVAGGMKALIITQFGGVGLMVGALIIFGQTGSFDIRAFLQNPAQLSPALLSLVGFSFLAAAAAKSAQVPFHTWLPDAMEAPTPVSALIHAATMVNAGIYLLARFYPALAPIPGWKESVMLVGLLTALFAAVMAIGAADLKRTLAYSTVSQLGYMVYAIGVGGLLASQFHLFSHAIFKALLFLGAGAVIHTVGTRDMRRMGGLFKSMPFVGSVFIIGALALAGLPPLNGFWSKESILEAGLVEGPTWAFGVMVFGAGLTALYSLRMVWMVFFGKAGEWPNHHIHDGGPAMRIALGILAAGTLTSWLLIGSFSGMLAETLPTHALHHLSLSELVQEILTAPATWIALLVIGMGLLCWVLRGRLQALVRNLAWLNRAAEASFGFESINRRVVQTVQAAACLLQRTQTGEMNWNLLGIVGGLVITLIILAWIR